MSTKFSRAKTPQPTPIICKTTSPCIMPPSPPGVLICTISYVNIHTDPEIRVSRNYELEWTPVPQFWWGESDVISGCKVTTTFWYDEDTKEFRVIHHIDHPDLMFIDDGWDQGILASVNPVYMPAQRYCETTFSGMFRYYLSQ